MDDEAVLGQFDDAEDELTAPPATQATLVASRAGAVNHAGRATSALAPEGCSNGEELPGQVLDDARQALLASLRPEVILSMTEIKKDTDREAAYQAGLEEAGPEVYRDASDEEAGEDTSRGPDTNADEVADEEEEEPCPGLCDEVMDPTPSGAMERATREYGLDILQICKDHNLEFMERVRLVNFLRTALKECGGNQATVDEAKVSITDKLAKRKNEASEALWHDDSWLIPVVPEDPLLTCLGELDSDQ